MTSASQQVVIIAVSVIAAISIVVAALLAKGTAYENTWFYLTCIWVFFIPALDAFFQRKKRD